MSTQEQVLAEVRHLRAEVAALRAAYAAGRIRHGWLRHVVDGLETDPHVQYKVHLWGVVYWLVNFPLVALLFFFTPALWLRLGIFITLIYSIYANLATDYGAMSAAMAAYGQVPLPEIPAEPHVQPPDAPGGLAPPGRRRARSASSSANAAARSAFSPATSVFRSVTCCRSSAIDDSYSSRACTYASASTLFSCASIASRCAALDAT